jgi:hypothetical protein
MYRVTYSRRVIEALRELVKRKPNHASIIRATVLEIDRRLKVYPQFGQPLRNLSINRAQHWIATFPPLAVHFLLLEYDDEKKTTTGFHGQVMVVRPFRPFSRSGIV